MNIESIEHYYDDDDKALIERLERDLMNYERSLRDRLCKPLFNYGWDTAPNLEKRRNIERLFEEDPVRLQMMRNIGEMKILTQKTRFILNKG